MIKPLNISKSGFSLIEVVVGLAIISVSFFAMSSVAASFVRISTTTTHNLQATLLLEESVEALRSIRDAGWTSNIASMTNETWYGLAFSTSTNKWATTTAITQIDNIYYRRFKTSAVYRDSNDDIASSGTLDTGTKKFTVEVYWRARGATSTKTVSTYLTNYFND